MNKAKNQKEAKKTNIFHFPNHINNLTFVLIIVIYGFILGLIITFSFPKTEYEVILNYPQGTYNEEINPYLFVRTVPTEIENADKEKEIDIKYDLYAYVRPMGENNLPTKVYYAYSALDNDGRMNYFDESAKNYPSGRTIPISYSYIVSQLSNKVGYDKIFIRAQYNIKVGGVDQTKFLKLSETVLKLTKEELSDVNFGQPSNTLVNFSFAIKDTDPADNRYEGSVVIEPMNLTQKYHINMQSWLVTEDETIYPYLGLYNYCAKIKFDTTNYTTQIFRYIKPAYIYMKLEYTNEAGEITFLYYKESVQSLLNSQNNQ
ncbi:MAG: hypothetical protein GX661_03270 [Acholeplasmataceae bacterium]|nr:hypothetical protein [Acholeplasmataceae bacterium]